MTGIIILAAGGSSRFGSPKQLAELHGKSLLRRAVETALSSELGPVQVVLGAAAEACRHTLQGLNVSLVINPHWQQGMGSSIVAGLGSWLNVRVDGVLLMLADQPGVSAEHLVKLASGASTSHPIMASAYSGKPGVPAWFSRHKFPALMALGGQAGGAQEIIRAEPAVGFVEFPAGEYDVDTPEDLKNFRPDNHRETLLAV